jgi:membrane protein
VKVQPVARTDRAHGGKTVWQRAQAFDASARFKRFVRQLERRRTLGVSAEVAFWLFLSLTPLAAFIGVLFVKWSGATVNSEWILSPLPRETRALFAAELARVQRWDSVRAIVITVFGFAWSASSGIHAIFDGLDAQSGCETTWVRKRATALGTLLWFLLLATLTGLAVQTTPNAARELLANAQVTAVVTPLGTTFIFALTLYWVGLPKAARQQWRKLIAGSGFVALVNAVSGFGYASYFRWSSTGAYGTTLSAVALTMFSLWILCLSMLVGLHVNFPKGVPSCDETDAKPTEAKTAKSRPQDM